MKQPIVITEIEGLIEQATKERSHYYVKAVAEKAILAIGMLMGENKRLTEALHKIKDNENSGVYCDLSCQKLAREAIASLKNGESK